MPKAETTLIRNAFKPTDQQPEPDAMILLPPRRYTHIDTLIDLLTLFMFPRLQPGVYRGQNNVWRSCPDQQRVNRKTARHLQQIWSGRIPNVTTITLKRAES